MSSREKRDSWIALVPLLAGFLTLVAYIGSAVRYRILHGSAFIALALVAIVTVRRNLQRAALGNAVGIVCGYFVLLLMTAIWARFPLVTLSWVAMDAIEAVVFAIFFLAARNSDARQITAAMAAIVGPAVVMAVVDFFVNPYMPRLAPNALILVPVSLAFCVAWRELTERKWLPLVATTLGFAFLLVGRSRAPLAAGVSAVAVMAWLLNGGLRARLHRLATFASLFVLAAAILIAIPATRPLVATTTVRLGRVLPERSPAVASAESEIRKTPYWGQARRMRDQIDIRGAIWTEFRALHSKAMPLGLGYMNFSRYFAERYPFQTSLHSVYMVWWLEGGVTVFLYAMLAIFGVVRSIRRAQCAEASIDQRILGDALLVSLGVLLFIGFFHQIHQSPAFWSILGLGSAYGTARGEPRAA